MSRPIQVRPDQCRRIIGEAARSRLPARLTYRTDAGWASLKSRFLEGDRREESVLVQVPGTLGQTEPAPEAGQEISVSFRRGSRKCVFSTHLLKPDTISTGGRELPAMRLAWPGAVHELQRRLYCRTAVPSGRFIPVDLWVAAGDGRPVEPLAQRGRMLDVSAGGLSLELPRELRSHRRKEDQVTCRFVPDPDRDPVEVTARLTNYTRLSNGHVRVGLQFMGLDTSERGRQLLHRISRMANRLRTKT